MSQHQYNVTVIAHLDGVFTTTDSEIRGLILETESFREMRDELCRVSSLLLRSNHNLSSEDIDNTVIDVKVRVDQEDNLEPLISPRVRYEDCAELALAS